MLPDMVYENDLRLVPIHLDVECLLSKHKVPAMPWAPYVAGPQIPYKEFPRPDTQHLRLLRSRPVCMTNHVAYQTRSRQVLLSMQCKRTR